MLRVWLIALVTLLITACATVKPLAPEVKSVSVRLGVVNLLQQQMNISLKLRNPNAFALPVQSLNYRLLAGPDNLELGGGQTQSGISLPAQGEGQIELSFNANLLSTLLKLQPNFRQGGELPVRLVGQVRIYDWLSVPLEKSTSLKFR